MKKLLLILPILFFLWELGYTQLDTFEDYVVDSVKIELPLFEKVFPGVQFNLYSSNISMPPTKVIKAKFKNKSYFLPDEINKLCNDFDEQNKIRIEDKVNVFLQFFFWNSLDSVKNIINLPCEKTSRSFENRNYNYKIYFSVGYHNYEILLQIIENKIKYIVVFVNNERIYSASFFLSHIDTKDINISIDNLPLEIDPFCPLAGASLQLVLQNTQINYKYQTAKVKS